jgi:hypothetical protein
MRVEFAGHRMARVAGVVATALAVAMVFAAVFAAAVPRRATAQTPPSAPAAAVNNAYRYRLLGVYDEQSGEPVEGVEVSDMLAGNKSLTSKTGTVSLFFLAEGTSLVRLRKVGYEVQTIPVTISPADTSPLTIVFRAAVKLPTMVVTDSAPVHLSPAMRSFDEHRREGLGQYLDETELRKNDNRTLANTLIAHFAGLTTSPGPKAGTFLVSSRKQCSGPAFRSCRTADCYIKVYLDNTPMVSPSGPIDFGHLSPQDYAAVEFYPSSGVLPAGFSATNADCGTLLLWSRER